MFYVTQDVMAIVAYEPLVETAWLTMQATTKSGISSGCEG